MCGLSLRVNSKISDDGLLFWTLISVQKFIPLTHLKYHSWLACSNSSMTKFKSSEDPDFRSYQSGKAEGRKRI